MSARKSAKAKRLRASVKAHNERRPDVLRPDRQRRARDSRRIRTYTYAAYRALMNPRIQGLLGMEKKFFDSAIQPTPLVTTDAWANGVYNPVTVFSATDCISTPAVGPAANQRVGKQITIKQLYLRGAIHLQSKADATVLPGQVTAFLAVVLDTQTNGAQVASEQIYYNPCGDIDGRVHPLRNLQNAQRFRVLKEQVFPFPAPAAAYAGETPAPLFVYGGTGVEFDWFIPLDLQVNFNQQTTAAIANVEDNSLHIIAACNDDVSVHLVYSARIRFLG